jgi:selenocysteine-specific elongation factor
VVTGTTISGSINEGDEVTIYPQRLTSRIRGIQIHNREVDQIRAGLRTAINLQGVEKSQIQRGNILATKDSLRLTYMVDVELNLLETSPRKLKNRAKARFHSGTTEIISTVVLLDRDELKQGDTCFAQIRLDEPTAVLQEDRFILRSYSPVRTIGGGKILNALPLKKKRFSERVLNELTILNKGSLQEKIEQFTRLGRFNGIESNELQFLTDSSKKKLDEALKKLLAGKILIQYNKESGTLIHSDFLEEAILEVISTLTKYHADYPLKAGLIKEELRSRTVGARNQRLFNFIISKLINDGAVVQEKELLRLKDHKVTLARDQEKIRREIEDIYLKGGLQPPYFKEINDKFSGDAGKELLGVMVKEGILIKIKDDLYFHHNAIEDLQKRLIDFLKKEGEISTPQFKDMTGASRKYTIPIIEYFDRSQLTVRVGDNRVLRKK